MTCEHNEVTGKSNFVSLPRWLVEWLLYVAEESRGQNEWKRRTSDRNNHEMAEMDRNIAGVSQYLNDADGAQELMK